MSFIQKRSVLAYLGKDLEKIDIGKVIEIKETVGPDTVKSVLNGGYYISHPC